MNHTVLIAYIHHSCIVMYEFYNDYYIPSKCALVRMGYIYGQGGVVEFSLLCVGALKRLRV